MPLGLFGSSSKPQPLTSFDSGGYKEKKESLEKDGRGTVLRLENTVVTVEKKLAEGGFAIVYLVNDKQNRQYALKRQFINDDNKQVEACRREFQIVSSLKGHKNIVSYVDHFLAKNKAGIYDYMLLTAYYRTSVLQLMNDRLLTGQSLRSNEVFSIFCDMCEAVARLHHSITPIIHRDLKVENILIDERNRAGPPVYVLCDFGSATTKVLSSNNYSVAFIQDEIEKYTTLSYRSPEMIDLYCGKPIGTKSDTWALGVMLYKLSYFCLPFGESAMAIQNGAFTFPSEPDRPDSLKAVIKCLLNADLEKRPSIYQCSVLAFTAADRVCPIRNVRGCRTPSLSAVVRCFRTGFLSMFEDEQEDQVDGAIPSEQHTEIPATTIVSLAPVSYVTESGSQTTSVQPRLRPKPTTSAAYVPFALQESKILPSQVNMAAESSASCEHRSGDSYENPEAAKAVVVVSDLGFTDLEVTLSTTKVSEQPSSLKSNPNLNPFVQLENENWTTALVESTSSTASLPVSGKDRAAALQSHRRNTSDTSQIIRSAFKPYSQGKSAGPLSYNQTSLSSTGLDSVCSDRAEESWNPFVAAPFGSAPTMDDSHFGKCFDELPRKSEKELMDSLGDIDRCSIDSMDPFGAAPFDPLCGQLNPEEKSEANYFEKADEDSVGSASDLRGPAMDEDSEQDEQRMVARRRFSYENIDGVGDDASSDSRGRTDHDSTDDISKNEESSYDEFKGECESSQHTDVADVTSDDDGTGSRPLLEDDALDDDEEDSFSGLSSSQEQLRLRDATKSLFIDPYLENVVLRKNTNPFLVSLSDETPKISPVMPTVVGMSGWIEKDSAGVGCGYDEIQRAFFPAKPIPVQPNPISCIYAPATLPRQSTPLTAAPRFIPRPAVPAEALLVLDKSLPLTSMNPVVTMKCASNMSQNSTQQNVGFEMQTAEQPVADMTSSVASTKQFFPVFLEKPDGSKSACLNKGLGPSYIEGPKTPKPKKCKEKDKKRISIDDPYSGSEVETDGSEAEMCTSTSSDKTVSKKKRKSFGLLGTNPSIAPLDLKMSSATSSSLLKKPSGKKVSSSVSSSSRKGSSGVLNASFINSSFLAEDLESPPKKHSLHL